MNWGRVEVFYWRTVRGYPAAANYPPPFSRIGWDHAMRDIEGFDVQIEVGPPSPEAQRAVGSLARARQRA